MMFMIAIKRSPFIKIFFYLSLFWLSGLEKLYAEETHLTFQLDNDLIFGTDRQYTGGFKVLWSQPSIPPVTWLFSPLDSLMRSNDSWLSDKTITQIDQMGFTTEVYTLQRKTENTQIPIGNTAWIHTDIRRLYQSDPVQTTIALNLGWFGPDNRGEDLHNGIHSVIGNHDVPGWNKQPPNRLTAQVSIDYQTKFFQSRQQTFNLFHSFTADIGTPFTGLGFGLGGYYAVNAQPIFSFNSLNQPSLNHQGTGWFVYSCWSAEYDYYNEFLDERFFTDESFILEESNLLRPTLEYGAGFIYDKFALSLHGTSIGQFYKGQTEDIFRFASLTLTFPF